MNIAITGANGYVGAHLTALLSKQGLRVTGLIRSSATKPRAPGMVQVNYDNVDSITSALKGSDVVIHLIAKTHGRGTNDIADYLEINRDISLRVAESALNAGVKTFIYMSSVKAVAESSPWDLPLTSATQAAPEDNYGRSKLSAELSLQQLISNSAMKLFIIRPPLVWGDTPKGNLATILTLARLRLPLPLAGIQNLRDWVSLENLCNFIAHLIQNQNNTESDVFYVSDNNPLSTTNAVRNLLKGAGVRPCMFTLPNWAWTLSAKVPKLRNAVRKIVGNLQIDITDTIKKTGWAPKEMPKI